MGLSQNSAPVKDYKKIVQSRSQNRPLEAVRRVRSLRGTMMMTTRCLSFIATNVTTVGEIRKMVDSGYVQGYVASVLAVWLSFNFRGFGRKKPT